MSLANLQFNLSGLQYIHELDDEYIIGNQVYTKQLTSSKPRILPLQAGTAGTPENFPTYNLDSDKFNLSGTQSLHEVTHQDTYVIYPRSQDNFVVSGFDRYSTIFESKLGPTAGKKYFNSKYSTIMEYSEGTCSVWYIWANVATYVLRIIGETVTDFYVSVTHKNSVSTNAWIGKVDKVTKSAVTLRTSPGMFYILEESDTAFIIATGPRGANGTVAFTADNLTYFSINKTTGTINSSYNVLPLYHTGTVRYFSGGPTNVTTDTTRNNANKHYLPFFDGINLKYKRISTIPNAPNVSGLLLSTDAVVCSFIDLPTNVLAEFAKVSTVTTPATYLNQNLQNYTFSINDKEYLVISNNADRGFGSTRAATTSTRFICVFEIDSTDSTKLIFKSFSELPTDILSINFSSDFRKIVLSSYRSVWIRVFNPISFSYVEYNVTNSTSGILKVAIDKTDKIWIYEVNRNLSIINPNNTITYQVTSPESVELSSYPSIIQFTVTAYSLLGSPVTRTVKLKVTGGTFNDGTVENLHEITNGSTIIPVTVTAPGSVAVEIVEDL